MWNFLHPSFILQTTPTPYKQGLGDITCHCKSILQGVNLGFCLAYCKIAKIPNFTFKIWQIIHCPHPLLLFFFQFLSFFCFVGSFANFFFPCFSLAVCSLIFFPWLSVDASFSFLVGSSPAASVRMMTYHYIRKYISSSIYL